MELTEQQVEGLLNEYVDIAAQIKELKAKQDAAKGQFVPWLEKVGAKKVSTKTFTASLSTRRGNVDMKKIQIAFKIADADLEAYRKPSSESWTVKKK